jgi:hypothetical protein
VGCNAVLKSIIFWDVTPCSLLRCNRRFGGTYRLHLWGRRKFQQEPASKQVALFITTTVKTSNPNAVLFGRWVPTFRKSLLCTFSGCCILKMEAAGFSELLVTIYQATYTVAYPRRFSPPWEPQSTICRRVPYISLRSLMV